MKKTILATTTKCLALMVLMLVAMITGAKAETITQTATFDSSVWGTGYKTVSDGQYWWNGNVKLQVGAPESSSNDINYDNNLVVMMSAKLTLTGKTGGYLTKFTITGSGDFELTTDKGTMTAVANGYQWEGHENEVVISCGGDVYDRQDFLIKSISVTYEISLDDLASTANSEAQYNFTSADALVGTSLHAKTISAGAQEMYLDGFQASDDPVIQQNMTAGGTYLHMQAGSRLWLKRSDSNSNVSITKAVFTFVSGSPSISPDGGTYDSSTNTWTGREEQLIFTFNDDADIRMVESEAATLYKVDISTYGRGTTKYGDETITRGDADNNYNGNATVYLKADESLTLTFTPDNRRYVSSAERRDGFTNTTDITTEVATGSYTVSGLTDDCMVLVYYDLMYPMIDYSAAGNGTIQLSATYLDDKDEESSYIGEEVSNDTKQVGIAYGGTLTFTMTPGSGYKLGTFMVNGQDRIADVVNNIFTVSNHTEAINVNATFVNATPEPYAVMEEDSLGNLMLTFMYDTNKTESDFAITTFANYGSREWDDISGEIKMVAFDESFKNYQPTSTAYWFYGMANLTDIQGIGNLNTSAVTSMTSMFERCSALITLDLSNFVTSQVSNMANMFAYCSALTTIYAGDGWSTESVQYSANMFIQCPNLVGSKGTTVTSTGADYARIDGGEAAPGYLSDPNAPTAYDVLVKVVGNGSVNAGSLTISSDSEEHITMPAGGSMTLTFTPTTGYKLGSVVVDDNDVTSQIAEDVTGARSYTLSGIYDTHTITVTFAEEKIWTVAGVNPLCETEWDPTATANDMSSTDGVVYTFVKEGCRLEAGLSYGFKIVANHAWDEAYPTDNYLFQVDENGVYTVTITFNEITKEITVGLVKTGDADFSEKVWTVVGSEALLGSDWDTTDTNNDMTFFFHTNVEHFLLGKKNVSLVADTIYEYKVVANHSWAENYGANCAYDGENITFSIPESGEYDLTFVFTPESKGCDIVYVMSNYRSNVWTISGSEAVLGSEWDCTDVSNDMTDKGDGTFILEKEKVSLMADSVYSYKVSADHSWEVNYGVDGKLHFINYEFSVPADGVYDVTFIFNTESKVTSVSAVLTSMPYAVQDGNTLTFYYDKQKEERQGMSVGPFSSETVRGWNDNRESITRVVFDESFKNYLPTSTAYWFMNLFNLTEIEGMSYLMTQNVTDMSYMFEGCNNLTTLDVSGFDTRNVTQMNAMFYYCMALTSLDVRSFNTANVTDMQFMFDGCSSLTNLDLTTFNTQNVSNMRYMFDNCSSLTTIYVGSSWTTAAVTDSYNMFSGCTALVGSKGTEYNNEYVDATYARIDGGAAAPGYLSDINAPTAYDVLVTVVGNGSVNAGSLTISGGSEEYITMPAGGNLKMFLSPATGYKIDNLKLDGVNKNDSIVPATATTAASYTLWKIYDTHTITVTFVNDTDEPYAVLDGNTLTFYYDNQKDVRNGMSVGPFSGYPDYQTWYGSAASITKVVFDASFANYTSLTSTAYWFNECSNLSQIEGMENLNTDNVTDMRGMFEDCSSLTSLDLSNFKTDNVTTLGGMFWSCTGLTSLDLSNFKTDNVTDMGSMFLNCSNLSSLNVSSFKTDNVMGMRGMFDRCSSLTSLDLSNFKTDNVRDMSQMFASCSGLTSLDLSNFKTDNVTDMSYMFNGCTNLTTIYVGSEWSTASVEDGSSMFTNCTSLVGGQGTVYDADHTDYTYARIDGQDGLPGYFSLVLSKGDADGNGEVNIADAVITVASILGEPTDTYFYKNMADMNDDSVIDIFDVSMIVTAVLNANGTSPAHGMISGIDNIAEEDVLLTKQNNRVYMGIDRKGAFTAFQFDVTLPEGTELLGASLANGGTNHQLTFVKRGDNQYRVVGLSMTNDVFSASNGHLIQLQLSDNSAADLAKVSNVLFVNPVAKENTAIREHRCDEGVNDGSIYNLKGQYLGKDKQKLDKGIYVINGKKVYIK